MYRIKINEVRMQELKRQIDDMREILNEICCTSIHDEEKGEGVRLLASRLLDDLIVEYMQAMYVKEPEDKCNIDAEI